MIELIEKVRKQATRSAAWPRSSPRSVPAGWGEPVFDKLKADLARPCSACRRCSASSTALASAARRARGSENNDRSVATRATPRDRDPTRTATAACSAASRRACRSSCVRRQADQQLAARARHGDESRRTDDDPHQGPPRSRACCRASYRWPRPWSRIVLADHWLRQLSITAARELLESERPSAKNGA